MDTKRFLLIAVLTGILSVLLHIGGLFSPGWIRTDFVDMGLWYACSDGRCISYQAITDALDSSSISFSYVLSDFFLEFQVEATIGFIAGIIGLALLSAGCRRHVNEARTLITISAIAFFISGIAAWIPAGRLLQLHSSISFLPTTYNVPYSAILTGLGATLAFIDVIIIVVVRCNSREPASAGQTLSPGYPMQTVVHGNPPNNQYPAYGHPHPQQKHYPNQGYNHDNEHRTKY